MHVPLPSLLKLQASCIQHQKPENAAAASMCVIKGMHFAMM
jgi:hypothetical protein